LFQLLLAFDAVPRPGHSLQALRVNFLSAVDALAKAAFADTRQSLFNHLQQLPFIVALAEQKFLGVGTSGAVGNILRGILVSGAAIRLGA